MILFQTKCAGLHFVLDVDKRNRVRLIHFSCEPFDEALYHEEQYGDHIGILELHGVGDDYKDHHASRHTKCCPGWKMQYIDHMEELTASGSILHVTVGTEALQAVVHYQFYKDAAVVRSYVTLKNLCTEPFELDYLTSFCLYGIAKTHPHWDRQTYLYIGHDSHHGELQWRRNTVWDMGLTKQSNASTKKLHWNQTGTWSTSEFLPMGVYENPMDNMVYYWQTEHNGSWYTEIGNARPNDGLYLQLCGPTGEYGHFFKTLKQGESFESVPVACGACKGGFDEAIGELTRYRRQIRRKNEDNEKLPIIFNDYMNCLWADPSTERELPLIDAAAKAGAEYFVMDAGWFTELEGGDGSWWSSIGIWKESKRRFPNGLNEVFDYVRSKGMKPGIWIEIEGLGPDSPLAKTLPDSWFFSIHGKRNIEHYRYQLDFRNPDVQKFADKTIDEIIKKYDLKYLKIDYNINAGMGTDYQADSIGDGLLEHCRAYLGWLDRFFERHPDVVVENCASGGQRMDYAMLSRLSIQSTSDQTKYDNYSAISAMAATAVTPEQAAVWSYPASYKNDPEETAYNMINAMLGRVHQSGFLNELSPECFLLVQEGLDCYKQIREDIRTGLPVFPLGLIWFDSPWAATGIRCTNKNCLYLSVWRKDGQEDTIEVPLPIPAGTKVEVMCKYPCKLPVEYSYNRENSTLRITLPEQNTARFFQIDF